VIGVPKEFISDPNIAKDGPEVNLPRLEQTPLPHSGDQGPPIRVGRNKQTSIDHGQ
jgi:hypothetical protein